MNGIDHIRCSGYIEGYYGRLLAWPQRKAIISQLSQLGMPSYFYAPKEDIYHRLRWREPYPNRWRDGFRALNEHARVANVHVIAGLAPGLDFNFADIDHGPDFIALVNKANQLLSDGASAIALLMDDINVVFDPQGASFGSEGEAHAVLANALSTAIGMCVFAVPRVYAHELEHESPGYADTFSQHLNAGNAVFHCGTHIVAPSLHRNDVAMFSETGHRVVFWDNLYANDYCPRRLFVGPWLGRSQADEVMLNPTGLVATDMLLLDIMSRTRGDSSAESAHKEALIAHGVPEVFFAIESFFRHPPNISEEQAPSYSPEDQSAAIEACLWRWKTALSREWYPYLFGLKHDSALAKGELPALRISKTQPQPLAALLLEHSR